MLVSQSKYNDAVAVARSWKRQYEDAIYEFRKLVKQWNELVDRINEKGGEEFLNSSPKSNQFTKQEIDSMIRLCHPDRHDNSRISNEITQKLLKMR